MKKILAFWTWLRSEERVVWLEYGGLSFVVLLPLLAPGYILTLDLVFTPYFSWPTELTNTYPLQVLLWLVHWILPGDVIEKIILFFILLFSGVSMHRLMRRIDAKDMISLDTWRLAAYFAGIFYMINPFTYSRFMAGQWMVLLGYALVPFFIGALWELLVRPSWRSALAVALWAFCIVTVSLHHTGIILVLGVLAFASGAVAYRPRKEHVRRVIRFTLLSVCCLTALSLFWLVPAILGRGTIGHAVMSFDQAHFTAFATGARGALGAIGEVIRLQGFWAESRLLYVLPQAVVPAWGLIFLFVWAAATVGGVKAWHRHKAIVLFSAGCIGVGVILSATPLLSLIGQSVPFAAGYREPHKFASLIVLGYAALGAVGAALIAERVRRRLGALGGQAAIIVFLFLPLAITPTMLWGFAGQLSPQTYPSEWFETNRFLKEVAKNDRVLFLPWHQYTTYDFSGRLIANPGEKFFEVPVIASDEPEFRDVPPTIPNEEKRSITSALHHPGKLSGVLTQRGIGYILLAKEGDIGEYVYLDTMPGIRLLQENAKLKLYKVEGIK